HRPLDQTPNEFAARAAAQLPTQADKILAFTNAYQNLCYASEEGQRSSLLRELRRLLGQIR
ncbi:MAG TPA: DUF4129 domain-containing protein, partial [Thiolinea sp.]|nr:DUF4129 domain-containing protein [Thiolinea sp.]